MAKHPKNMTADEAIIAGCRSLEDSLARGESLSRRKVTMEIRFHLHSVKGMRALRRKLGASQGVMASFLGVSPITLQSWEQGKRKPSPMARRFMDELNRNPAY